MSLEVDGYMYRLYSIHVRQNVKQAVRYELKLEYFIVKKMNINVVWEVYDVLCALVAIFMYIQCGPSCLTINLTMTI